MHRLQREFPSDYTRLACPSPDCDWCGEVTELDVWKEPDETMLCTCPQCVEIIFEQLVQSPVKANGDTNAKVSDQEHQTQPIP